jgi:hypothetical protein
MKGPRLEPVYEEARTWAVHPISHPPPGWAHIVRRGIATWMRETPAGMETPKSLPQPARLDVSPLLTIVAAMIAEVCQ